MHIKRKFVRILAMALIGFVLVGLLAGATVAFAQEPADAPAATETGETPPQEAETQTSGSQEGQTPAPPPAGETPQTTPEEDTSAAGQEAGSEEAEAPIEPQGEEPAAPLAVGEAEEYFFRETEDENRKIEIILPEDFKNEQSAVLLYVSSPPEAPAREFSLVKEEALAIENGKFSFSVPEGVEGQLCYGFYDIEAVKTLLQDGAYTEKTEDTNGFVQIEKGGDVFKFIPFTLTKTTPRFYAPQGKTEYTFKAMDAAGQEKTGSSLTLQAEDTLCVSFWVGDELGAASTPHEYFASLLEPLLFPQGIKKPADTCTMKIEATAKTKSYAGILYYEYTAKVTADAVVQSFTVAPPAPFSGLEVRIALTDKGKTTGLITIENSNVPEKIKNAAYGSSATLLTAKMFSNNNNNIQVAKAGDFATIRIMSDAPFTGAALEKVIIAGKEIQVGANKTAVLVNGKYEMDFTSQITKQDVLSLNVQDQKPVSGQVIVKKSKTTNRQAINMEDMQTTVLFFGEIELDANEFKFYSVSEARQYAQIGEALHLEIGTNHPVFLENPKISKQSPQTISPAPASGSHAKWFIEGKTTDEFPAITDGCSYSYSVKLWDEAGNTITVNQDTLPDQKVFWGSPPPVANVGMVVKENNSRYISNKDTWQDIEIKIVPKAGATIEGIRLTGVGPSSASLDFEKHGNEFKITYSVNQAFFNGLKNGQQIGFSAMVTYKTGELFEVVAPITNNWVADAHLIYVDKNSSAINGAVLATEVYENNKAFYWAAEGKEVTLSFFSQNELVIDKNSVSIGFKSTSDKELVDANNVKVVSGGQNQTVKIILPEAITASHGQQLFVSLQAKDLAGNSFTLDLNSYNTVYPPVMYYAPIRVTSLRMYSMEYPQPSWVSFGQEGRPAKSGDTVALKFETSQPVDTLTISIAGENAHPVIKGGGSKTEWLFYYTLPVDIVLTDNEMVPFEFILEDGINLKTKFEGSTGQPVKQGYMPLSPTQPVLFHGLLSIDNITFTVVERAGQPGAEITNKGFAKNEDTVEFSFTTNHKISFGTGPKNKKSTFAGVDLQKGGCSISQVQDAATNDWKVVIRCKIPSKAQADLEDGAYLPYTLYTVDESKQILLLEQGVKGNMIFQPANGQAADWLDENGAPAPKIIYYAPLERDTMAIKLTSSNDRVLKKGGAETGYTYALAKNGDEITLTVNTGHPVLLGEVSIANTLLTAGNAGIWFEGPGGNMQDYFTAGSSTTMATVWVATYIITGEENLSGLGGSASRDDGLLPFKISFKDTMGQNVHVNQNMEESNRNKPAPRESDKVHYMPPVAPKVSLASDVVGYPGLSRDGSEITFTFEANHAVVISGVTFPGKRLDSDKDAVPQQQRTLLCEVQNGADGLVDNGGIPFEITGADAAGNEFTVRHKQQNPDPALHYAENEVIYYAPICTEGLGMVSSSGISMVSEPEVWLAKNGDTVTLSFKTMHPVYVRASIADMDPQLLQSEDGMTWSLEYKIPVLKSSLEDNKNISFSIEVWDNAGNDTLYETQADIPDESYKTRYYAPIEVHNLTIVSDNQKTPGVVARDGDTITVSFETTHPVTPSAPSVYGKHFALTSEDNEGMVWQGTFTIENGDIEDNAWSIFKVFLQDEVSQSLRFDNTNEELYPLDQKVQYFAPIAVTNVVFTSSNVNDKTKYAKDEDSLTLEFTTNHQVDVTTASIAGKGAAVTQLPPEDENSIECRYSLTYTLVNGDLEDLAEIPFLVTLEDIAGNDPVTKTHTDADVPNRLQYFAPIEAVTSISSNNARNTDYAKNGDIITLVSRAQHMVLVQDADIAGRPASSSGDGTEEVSISYGIPAQEDSMPEGPVSFFFTLTDPAGNLLTVSETNDAGLSEVIYDRTRPEVKITPAFNGFTNQDVNCAFLYSDTNIDGSGLSLLVNEKEQIGTVGGLEFTHTQPLTLEPEGFYELIATATDLAGNTTERAVTARLVIDKTNPKLWVIELGHSGAKTYKGGFVLQDIIGIEEEYLNEIICTLTDNAGVHQWELDKPIEKDGKKTAFVVATDVAGNASTALSYDFYIDGTPPQPLVTHTEPKKELDAARGNTVIGITASLEISLRDLQVAEEELDSFTRLQLLDSEGKLVADLLAAGPQDTYTYLLKKGRYGNYVLEIDAVDSVGNQTNLSYRFSFRDKTLWQKFYENKPLFYSVLGVLALSAVVGGILLYRKRKKQQGRKKPSMPFSA